MSHNPKKSLFVPRYQLLVNPGLEIWQRGTGAFTAVGFSADYWVNAPQGTSTMSTSRDGTNQDAGSIYCAAVTYVHGSLASYFYHQNFEQYLVMRGKTVSGSIRVKCSTASAVRLYFYDSVNGYRYSSYHSGGGAWETLKITAAAVDAAASSTMQFGIQAGVTCTFYVDNAILVYGEEAPDYVPLHPADDLARCQRYYEVHGGDVSADLGIRGYGATGGNIAHFISFAQRKANAPSVTKNGTWTVSNCGQPAFLGSGGHSGYNLNIVVTSIGEAYAYSNAAGQTITAQST